MATQKPKPKLPLGLVIACGVAGAMLARVPGALPYVLGGCAIAIVGAIWWDKRQAKGRAERRQKEAGPSTFRSGLYNPNAKIAGLSVLSPLTYLVEPDGTEVLRVTMTNQGDRPLGPLPMELALTFTNMFGNPARGGNHWDGLLLQPPAPIAKLDPGETITIDIFRSNAEPAIIDQSDHEKKLEVRAKVEDAPSILEFMRTEPTGAFDIHLRIGSPAHGAAWRPDRPDLDG